SRRLARGASRVCRADYWKSILVLSLVIGHLGICSCEFDFKYDRIAAKRGDAGPGPSGLAEAARNFCQPDPAEERPFGLRSGGRQRDELCHERAAGAMCDA